MGNCAPPGRARYYYLFPMDCGIIVRDAAAWPVAPSRWGPAVQRVLVSWVVDL